MNIVEAMARAIQDATDDLSGDTIGVVIKSADHLFPTAAMHDGNPTHVAYNLAMEHICRQAARAALAAMDDPTLGMVEAGQETGPIGCCNPIPSDITEIWQAMCRAALDEGEG